jgi:hypothetical protein
MNNGRAAWGYTIEGTPSAMLQAALRSIRRNGDHAAGLPPCEGEACDWVKRVASCLFAGTCEAVVLFCGDPGLACCVANKVPGVRAVAVWTLTQARRAINTLGANLLAVEMAGRTYFECRELLRLCQEKSPSCPDGVACVLEELDGHAHR